MARHDRAHGYRKVLGLEKDFFGKKYPHVNWKEVEHMNITTFFFVQVCNYLCCWNKTVIKQKETRIYIQIVLPLFSNSLWPGWE